MKKQESPGFSRGEQVKATDSPIPIRTRNEYDRQVELARHLEFDCEEEA